MCIKHQNKKEFKIDLNTFDFTESIKRFNEINIEISNILCFGDSGSGVKNLHIEYTYEMDCIDPVEAINYIIKKCSK